MIDIQVVRSLERVVNEADALNSKLILLVGGHRTGKSSLLQAFGRERCLVPLQVGAELGARLAVCSLRRRQLQTSSILRDLADDHAKDNLLLLDNIELLFDRCLQLDPLDVLKQQARSRRVISVWPGELRGDAKTGRLTYAEIGHPEHQDYGLAGVVLFEIQH